MEGILIACLIIFILIAAVYLYQPNKKAETDTGENKEMKLTEETRTTLQIEKAKSEINLSNQKANFFKNLADLTALINIIIIIAIIASVIAFIASMASCAGLSTNLKF